MKRRPWVLTGLDEDSTLAEGSWLWCALWRPVFVLLGRLRPTILERAAASPVVWMRQHDEWERKCAALRQRPPPNKRGPTTC